MLLFFFTQKNIYYTIISILHKRFVFGLLMFFHCFCLSRNRKASTMSQPGVVLFLAPAYAQLAG